LSLVNFQEKLPNIPVRDLRVVVNVPERIRQVTEVGTSFLAPQEEQRASGIRFRIDRLDTLEMYALEWA